MPEKNYMYKEFITSYKHMHSLHCTSLSGKSEEQLPKNCQLTVGPQAVDCHLPFYVKFFHQLSADCGVIVGRQLVTST